MKVEQNQRDIFLCRLSKHVDVIFNFDQFDVVGKLHEHVPEARSEQGMIVCDKNLHALTEKR